MKMKKYEKCSSCGKKLPRVGIDDFNYPAQCGECVMGQAYRLQK